MGTRFVDGEIGGDDTQPPAQGGVALKSAQTTRIVDHEAQEDGGLDVIEVVFGEEDSLSSSGVHDGPSHVSAICHDELTPGAIVVVDAQLHELGIWPAFMESQSGLWHVARRVVASVEDGTLFRRWGIRSSDRKVLRKVMRVPVIEGWWIFYEAVCVALVYTIKRTHDRNASEKVDRRPRCLYITLEVLFAVQSVLCSDEQNAEPQVTIHANCVF